jgi:hypothetical protein
MNLTPAIGVVAAILCVLAAYGLGYSAGYSKGRGDGFEDGKREGAKESSARAFAVGFDRGKRAANQPLPPEPEPQKKGCLIFLLLASNAAALGWAISRL